MRDVSLRQLLVRQMHEVQDRHPDLELALPLDCGYRIRGTVGFQGVCGEIALSGRYMVELRIPPEYPDAPPDVRETGGRIPRWFHTFSPTGKLCLGPPVEVERVFAERRTLLWFLEEQVVPFLFSYSYFEKHGRMPFGQLPHGANGILDYYNEFFETDVDVVTLRMLNLLSGTA